VRPAGHVTKVGWGPEPMNFSMDALVKKAVTLQGSFSHTWPAWERVLAMMGTGQLDPRPYLSKVSSLDAWKDCFDGMHEARYIKAVLTP
jgi:alcohol dehydrogenase/L-iditol 2-dehydrogenase